MKQWQVDRKFTPKMKPKEIRVLVNGWTRAVKAAEAWAGE
jgi:glycerol kinase